MHSPRRLPRLPLAVVFLIVSAGFAALAVAWGSEAPRERAARVTREPPRTHHSRPPVTRRAPALRALRPHERVIAAHRASHRHAASKTARNVYAAIASHALSAKVRGIPPRVYVPDTLAGRLDVIDPSTGRVLRRLHVGVTPHHVTPSWDLRWLYVDNTTSGTLTVISARTGRRVRTVHVRDPYNLYFTPDGRQAVVVAEGLQRLDFRNPRTWRLIESVPIGPGGPDHLDFSSNGRYLLISAEWSGRVVRVDVTQHRVTGEIVVGGLPVDVKLAPDGSVFYVANQGRGGVSIVDGDRLREIAFLPTGAGAHGLCVSRDGRLLYVSNRLDGSISVLDLTTRRVTDRWQVGGSPDMMQLSADGRKLWASNRFGSSVSVVDTETGRLVRMIPVGAGPHGLTLFPQPGRFSLGHNGVYR